MIFQESLIPKNLEQYNKLYKESVSDPEMFWSKVANSFLWKKKWDKVLEYDFSKPYFKWFSGAKLNITENCLDRDLVDNPNKTAIIFEPNNPDEKVVNLSYSELHQKVCKFSNVLKSNNIKTQLLTLNRLK